MDKTTRVMTDWGELSITYRQGYCYAVKTIRGIKRQIYLGKSIPCQERLEEVAEEINLRGELWIAKHGKKVRRSPTVDTTDSLSTALERLRRIQELADARGEKAIATQISQVIRTLKQINLGG